MAAKAWEKDFRYPAIQASIRALGEACHDDPFRFPGSFCLPVAARPITGWTPGRVAMVAIVLGFALLCGGVLLASLADRAPPGTEGSILLALGGCCTLAGIATFFVPAKADRQILRRILGVRGRELLERPGLARVLTAELSDADRSKMRLSVDGDDHLLIACDESGRRLLIEGIGARYQIRSADVEHLAAFEYLNYIGAEITYRIDGQTRLRIAIARVSILRELIRQVPILFFLRGTIRNRLLEHCEKTLQPRREVPA